MEVKKDIRVVQLPLFEVEITYFRDTLKAILHTIFFHRVLGPVSPLDVTIDTLDITYARCNEKKTEQIIEKKIEEMFQIFKKNPKTIQKLEILFYQKLTKDGWFRNSEILEEWEKWGISVKLLPASQEPALYRKELAEKIEKIFTKIMTKSTTSLPHINPDDLISYPFNITLPEWNGGRGFFTFFSAGSVIS